MDILLDDIAINQEAQNRDYTNYFWWMSFGKELSKTQLKKLIEWLNTLEFHEDWGGESGVMLRDYIVKTIEEELK